ncbi:hypothetical protein [Mucilaginibacter flavus]|uniref:hypothetical protein n=1 Tax=Mucilaginibacter flavus TaxID=931504 RepID=UPI0025B562F3|nr:hypothetical protein [Mucilaginibacter flavus]MDN3580120.1 hypothetical protein [Mucilaginibacter flavus]
MKQIVKNVLFVMAFGLLMLAKQPANAQCAQCAATVETNTAEGGKKAQGLNKGILFLLGAPYLMVGAGGYVWYKNYRRKNVNLNMREEKLNLN